MLNLLEEAIRNMSKVTMSCEEKPVVVRFNPWLFSDQQQLISQFFKQLSSEIGSINSGVIKSAGQIVEKFGKAVSISSVIPTLSILAPIAETFQSLGKLMQDTDADIIQIKKDLVKELSEAKIKTVIIIDDIDRLTKKEIRTVFQLMKSIADFPNTIYVIAFDYRIVSEALAGENTEDGGEYLEKFIQMPFHLPKVSEQQITHLLQSQIGEIIGELDDRFDVQRFQGLFYRGISPLCRTVRDVVRLCNAISFRYTLLKKEVDDIDLLGISAIQVFFPDIYSELASATNRDQICKNSWSEYREEERTELSTWFASLTAGLSPQKQNQISELLFYMFPSVSFLVRKSLSGAGYDAARSV